MEAGRSRQAADLGVGPTESRDPRGEPRFRQYSLYSDLLLRRYLRSLDDGVLVTMQPGLNLASARFGRDSVCASRRTTAPSWAGPARSSRATCGTPGASMSFLTLTQADARKYRKVLGREVGVRAIGNGTPAYDGPLADQTSSTVVAAGRLSRTKGFDILIDAWSQVAAAHPTEPPDLG